MVKYLLMIFGQHGTKYIMYVLYQTWDRRHLSLTSLSQRFILFFI